MDLDDTARNSYYNQFHNLYLGRHQDPGAVAINQNQWLNGLVEAANCDYNQFKSIMADTKNDDPVSVSGANSVEDNSMEIDYTNSD